MPESIIDFPGSRRIHVALAVTDLARSRAFYRALLDVEPSKVRPGYVKFEPDDPSVNLTLNEVATVDAPVAPAHFGVQVMSTDAVLAAARRLREAGLETDAEQRTTCCYAVQDKVWVTDPDGHHWEVFVVLDDAATRAEADAACCDPHCCSEA
jgi:catechol 2,3-dioxygenase-like lactoylglutathione lyase family enzyme